MCVELLVKITDTKGCGFNVISVTHGNMLTALVIHLKEEFSNPLTLRMGTVERTREIKGIQ